MAKALVMGEKISYKFSIALHFVLTFLLVSFSIVALVQGIRMQFAGETALGLAFYFTMPLLVFVSYLAYRKAHYQLGVLAMSRN